LKIGLQIQRYYDYQLPEQHLDGGKMALWPTSG
jgi:hypothetical protein